MMMESIVYDVRYAARNLLKNPGFALAAILTLSIGIGANTAIFTAVNGVLLRPLPYPEPERLVQVWGFHPEIGTESMSFPDFVDWRAQNTTLASMSGYFLQSVNLTGAGDAERLLAARVSGEFFETFRITPSAGRTFTLEDDLPGAPRTAVLSHSFWERRFGRDPTVIGSTITLHGTPVEVVGIAADGFEFPKGVSLWQPMSLEISDFGRRGDFVRGVARLDARTDFRTAQAEMTAIAARLEQEYPETNTNWTSRLIPLHDEIVGDVRPALLTLLGAVSLVLLIACTNVANLLLARSAGRHGEIAVKSALGASVSRIIRQLLAESGLLAVLGMGGGLILATGLLRVFLLLGADSIPRSENVIIDAPVLGFAAGVTLLTAILFGLFPAVQLSKSGIAHWIGTARTVTGGGRRARNLLVMTEVALAVVLLVGSTLLLKSFANLRAIDPGHVTEGIVSVRLSLPRNSYPEGDQVLGFYDELKTRLAALPGAEAVAVTEWLPPEASGSYLSFDIEGRPMPADGVVQDANINIVDHSYFEALEIPITEGRGFTSDDKPTDPTIAVISESMANLYWPDQSALGERISFGGGYITIVGVAANVKNAGLSQASYPLAYRLHNQLSNRGMTVILKSGTDASALIPLARAGVAAMDPNLPIHGINTIENMLSDQLAQSRFTSLLIAALGAVSLVLAVIGLYGVTSYVVSEKTREIGVRMALGATRRSVVGLFTGKALGPVVIGCVVGLGAAAGLSRLLSSLLFEIPARDPATYATVAGVLIISAAIAAFFPASRASRIDPSVTLRGDG